MAVRRERKVKPSERRGGGGAGGGRRKGERMFSVMCAEEKNGSLNHMVESSRVTGFIIISGLAACKKSGVSK